MIGLFVVAGPGHRPRSRPVTGVPANGEAAPPFEIAEPKRFAASLGSDNVKNDIIAKWLMHDWSRRLSTTHQKHK